MRPARALGLLAFVAAAMAAQAFVQQPLARANQVRSARHLDTAPRSLAFRLATGGVTEAAGDALWLSVLPRLGRPWADPMRKAAWIEAVTGVLADANPRAHFPITYAAYFIEFIQARHPGIERVLRHGMEVEKRGAFGVVERPNASDWELPMALGMNLVLHGTTPAERERGMEWLRTAATKPACPLLIIEYVAALRAREGNPLEGWFIWSVKSTLGDSREWREICLREMDRCRLDALRKWAIAAGKRLGRWPATVEEVLAEAPATTREFLAAFPEKRAALLDAVRLLPATRDIQIPVLAERLETGGKAEILDAVRGFEAEHGKLPENLRALELSCGRAFAAPPLNGTRWELDPSTGVPGIVVDMVDPRLGQ